jgi:hypothetical protein
LEKTGVLFRDFISAYEGCREPGIEVSMVYSVKPRVDRPLLNGWYLAALDISNISQEQEV